MNLFHSARLKLTAFYFGSLVVFCLLLTFGVRTFTSYELKRGDAVQRGAVHSLVERYVNTFQGNVVGPPPPGDRMFDRTQANQDSVTRQHLNRDFLFIDLGLLAIGAVLSYWYAGRTLKPIEAAHELQKRFTADASHELRTPLTSMKLENEVFLRQKHFSEADARELIASNLEEVERLERLATNLLSLNQYEQISVVKQPLAIERVVQSAVDAAKRHKTMLHTDFSIQLAPATIQANQESLGELLGILFDNAVKYGPHGGPVEITGLARDGSYQLQVHDHGPGIADKDLPHIFERMYRGDTARGSKVGGHGIGLSLAQQIAAANDAALTAANHPGGGAVFTLTLPG